MAFIRAERISVASISAALTLATDQARAVSVMTLYRASRFFSVSFFESFRPSIRQSGGRITAAAYTGPISGPAPASSTPQTVSQPCAHDSCSYVQRLLISPPPPFPA